MNAYPLTEEQLNWGFVCGRVSCLEPRLLDRDFFLSLLAQPKNEDVLRQLQETALHEFVIPGAGWQDWSAIADRFFHANVMSLSSDSPEPHLALLWLLGWDYLNLRAALSGNPDPPMPCGVISEERLRAVAAGDLTVLPPLVSASLIPFTDALAGKQDVPLDIVIDGAYLRGLLGLAKTVDVPLITACAQGLASMRLILMLWRAQRTGHSLKTYQQYLLPLDDVNGLATDLLASPDPKDWAALIPGELGDLFARAQQEDEDERVAVFEQNAAGYLMQLARQGQGQVYGPERLFSFITALHSEVHNLKVAVCGRLNGIDQVLIRRRLRESYG